jgi:cytochrome c
MRAFLASFALSALVACGPQEPDPVIAEIVANTGGRPDSGAAAIARYGCGSCHVIPGIPVGRGMVGPPLTDFARRAFIAGQVVNAPGNLIAWIQRPDSVEPGTAMPPLGVTRQEARDIAAYLYLNTATGGLGPPRLLSPSVLPHQ